MRLLRAGKAYKAIATELGIGSRTAGEYVERIYRKLGIQSRNELHDVIGAWLDRSRSGVG